MLCDGRLRLPHQDDDREPMRRRTLQALPATHEILVVGTGTWVCFPVLEARKNEINQGVLEINPERLDCCLINRRWLLDANLDADTAR